MSESTYHPVDYSGDLEKGNTNSSNDDFPTVDRSLTHTSFRHDQKNIYINDVPISKAEFTEAFGGTFEVGQREKTDQLRTYANPVPAGLAAFSASAFSLGLVQIHARSVTAANSLLGAFLTTSGLVCMIVGILCFIIGNTWASCTFLMFGGFWSSYAFLLMNVGDISGGYATSEEYAQSIALFFTPWVFFSFILWICTFKSTIPLTILMFLIWFFILLFTIGQYIGSVEVFKAGGYFCLLAGVAGFYNVLAGLIDETNSYFVIRPFEIPNFSRKQD